MFAKTLFRMGIPVSPKNIFPSNIQGLPTWYEVRVSEKGYLGRRDGIDLMVAMNPQSYTDDLAEIVPGGWLFYDSSMPRIWPRDDITVLGMLDRWRVSRVSHVQHDADIRHQPVGRHLGAVTTDFFLYAIGGNDRCRNFICRFAELF